MILISAKHHRKITKLKLKLIPIKNKYIKMVKNDKRKNISNTKK